MSDGPVPIAYVVDNLRMGGVRTVVLRDLAGLPRGEFAPTLVSLQDDIHLIDPSSLPPHVRTVGVAYSRRYGYRTLDYVADSLALGEVRRGAAAVIDAIRGTESRIVHFHTLPRNLALGVLLARAYDAELVFTDHSARLRQSDYGFLSRTVLGMAFRRLYRRYHTISVSPVVSQVSASWGWLNPRKHHMVLENTIDLDRFHPPAQRRAGGSLTVVCVARIQPAKGHRTLIQAVARVPPSTPVRLLIVGPDETDGGVQQLASDTIHPPHRVEFLGERSDIPEILREADVGVLPSHREGLSLAVLEMMASALPVLVSDIPEHRYLVRHGVNGMLVPVGDPDALGEALHRLSSDGNLRRSLGEAARDSVREMEVESTGSRLAAFYRRILSRA